VDPLIANEQLRVFCIHVCSDKLLADEFFTVSIIFVAKHHGPCTAENCRKTKLSTSIIASPMRRRGREITRMKSLQWKEA